MRLGWLALLVALVGCQQYPFVFQTNQRVGGRVYRIQVQTEGATDILFVVDNSGSMAEEQQKLKDNMAAFIEVLTRSVNDYQVGLVSTDMLRRPGVTGCTPCCDLDLDGNGLPEWSNCDAGRLIAADAVTRVFRRPVSDDPTELAELTAELILGFNSAVTSLGTGGSAIEAPFAAVQAALDPAGEVAVRALNRGFLRANADLAVIFLSDEDDCTFPAAWYDQAGRDDVDCYTDPGAMPPEELLDFLVAVKGDLRRVRAAGIIGATPSDDPARSLGQAAAGCVTVVNPGQPDDGAASNSCGCWSARYLPDRRPGQSGDFYCNYLAAPPFNQLAYRSPDLGNGQGGCITLAGSRYLTVLETLAARRAAAGLQPGVLVDSICRADYRQTLEQIAVFVVLSNCFRLVETPAFAIDGSVVLLRNGEALVQVPAGSGEPGWSYDASTNSVCLEGGLVKEVGDVFEITVLTELQGLGD